MDDLIKIISVASQDRLIAEVGRQSQVFESRRHIKQAASPLFDRETLLGLAPPRGWFMSHMITLGSFEKYGENRNKDGWPHEELMRKHATFVTHARNYREHRNQDPSLALGVIKMARYCPVLQRGEVVMWTEIAKAEKEFEKAASGEELSGSMAARVKCDICTACGFRSERPDRRCDCIRLHAGRWFPEKSAYAIMMNVDPTFRDYSYVERPADRIAHYVNYGFHKAASAPQVIRGDEVAAAYGLGALSGRYHLRAIVAADNAAKSHDRAPADKAASIHVLPYSHRADIPAAVSEKMAGEDPGKVMQVLCRNGLVLTPEKVWRWVMGRSCDATIKEASAKMAGIRVVLLQRMEEDPDLAGEFEGLCGQFAPADSCCALKGDPISAFFDAARDQFAARYEVLAKSAAMSAAMDIPPRQVADTQALSPSPEALAFGMVYNAYLAKSAQVMELDEEKLAVVASLR